MSQNALIAAQYDALAAICGMIRDGAEPAHVAAYVLTLGAEMPGVSMAIENAALEGTFAEAVFHILCAD